MEEQKATKVTLYLPPDLHRQLKIRSAVDGEAMSSIAKRAIDFYLAHGEAVTESLEASVGQSHRVHSCPSCASPVVLSRGELVQVSQVTGHGKASDAAVVPDLVPIPGSREEGELVVC
ncbi:hypothetical protein IQ254_05120 [Nodosilinea sp. LEGE 07088]|uniref:hypothetical protein n=1 Tax=Nodosilinea sp. LEGE 07088 TaxID=2777968 RepID=UPI0018819376|nr:hypothetical protein [Nodosilinea sp. LEGE 07088]MBE9136586.1 hypothetical protein [Nodosilinea sp. LEGE 07088]